MSRAPHEAINVQGAVIGDNQYPPQSAPDQAPQGMSNFVDSSGPIFSMYLEMATEEDKKMVENWKADADGMLIFTGLFSAAVASLISVSIQDIRSNPQDTSNFYLANIYQTVADSNPSDNSSPLPSSPPPFSPPNYAVCVNAFWFMSLVISLTCALLATLLQQWARRYLKVTQPRYSPHKRARIRSFFFEGVDKYLMSWVVDALPALLHVSLFLFFGGLVMFLCNVDLTIFILVLSWVSVCMAVYGCITFMPIFRHDSPYHTPLSSPAWHFVAGMSYVTFRIIRRLTLSNYFSSETYIHFSDLAEHYRELLVGGMLKTAEETALSSPSEIDARAFMWTFDSLDEDHELERFFSGLPGFRSSRVVNDPLPSLSWWQKERLLNGLIGLSDRTSSSNLLPESVKSRRAVISAKALGPVELSNADLYLLQEILSEWEFRPVESVGIANLLKDWGYCKGENVSMVFPAIVSSVVAGARRRDDLWFALVSYELGVPESVLRGYAAHGDNLSLAILIHVTRQQFSHFSKESWPKYVFSYVLERASKFNVEDTSPELQHKFCALWNQIVLKVQNDNDQRMTSHILGRIRNVYVGLHHATDSAPTRFSASTGDRDDVLKEPSSYPVCNVSGHIHCDSASTTVPHITTLFPISLSSLDLPSSSTPAPLVVNERTTDIPLLDNDTYDSWSFHPAHHTAPENPPIPPTSPDPPTAGAIRDVTSGKTVLHPTRENTIPAPPFSSSPPAAVSHQHNPDLLTPSEPSNHPSYPVPDHTLPTESHYPILVTTAPDASPGSASAPDLGAAVEDDRISNPVLRKEKDAFSPPLANRAIHATMATLDHPPLPSDTDSDVAVVSRSHRVPNIECSGDDPQHPSHGLYGIV